MGISIQTTIKKTMGVIYLVLFIRFFWKEGAFDDFPGTILLYDLVIFSHSLSVLQVVQIINMFIHSIIQQIFTVQLPWTRHCLTALLTVMINKQ